MARDYVHVADIARANRYALTAGSRRTYNLGSGIATSVNEILSLVQTAVGGEVTQTIYLDQRPGEVDRICLDSSLAKLELGWKPSIPVEEGIDLTVRILRGRMERV